MSSSDDLKFSTLAIHAADHLSSTSDVAPPLHVSTTFRYAHPLDPASTREESYFSALPPGAAPEPHIYSRLTAPSSTALETTLNSLFNGHTVTYASGLAAFSALLIRVNPKRLLIGAGYHGCHGAAAVLSRISGMQICDLRTTPPQPGDLLHLETPENPTGEAHPIREFADRARAAGAVLSVDATFAPPPLQDPLRLGADWVLHSGTKYVGGHSDMLCGILVTREPLQAKRLREERMLIGGVMGSLEAWLGVRSVKTLELRVRRQSENAEALVKWVKSEWEGKGVVERVCAHSALQAETEEWVREQMPGGYASVFSLVLASEGMARRLPEELELFMHATSLGGVESLVEWRIMSDSKSDRRLLRFSIGIEDVGDLKRDLERAFRAVGGHGGEPEAPVSL